MTEETAEQRDRKYPRVKETCNVKYHVVENSSMSALQLLSEPSQVSAMGVAALQSPQSPSSQISVPKQMPF